MENQFDFTTKCRRSRPRKNGFAWALTLILAGLVFLCINTGIIPSQYKSLLTAWPIWLVLAGIFCLFHKSFSTSFTLLAVGAFFLVPYMSPIHPEWGIPENFTSVYWPLLLIVAGLLIIIESLFKHHSFICHGWNLNHTSKWETEDGFLNVDSAFDSRKNIVLDPIFKGGNVKCAFGEVVVDLRKTTLPEGNTKLYVDLSFGSVSIIVPDTWNVQIHGNGLFGTFSDHRLTKSYYPDEPKKLTIEGKCAFGECEIRD